MNGTEKKKMAGIQGKRGWFFAPGVRREAWALSGHRRRMGKIAFSHLADLVRARAFKQWFHSGRGEGTTVSQDSLANGRIAIAFRPGGCLDSGGIKCC
jgi:hypothetical protein